MKLFISDDNDIMLKLQPKKGYPYVRVNLELIEITLLMNSLLV